MPVQRLYDDVAVFLPEGIDFPAVAGHKGWRHQFGKHQRENLLRAGTHTGRIIDHKGLARHRLQQVASGDVGHVEWRVLAHQHHIDVARDIQRLVGAEETGSFADALNLCRPGPGGHAALAEGKVGRAIDENIGAPGLRHFGERKGGVPVDVDLLQRVHLNGNSKRHAVLPSGVPGRQAEGSSPPKSFRLSN
jgi:hypothetical protein